VSADMQLKLVTGDVFVFGKGSLFDAEVTNARDLPCELPVEQFVKEVLYGMLGAPKNSRHEQYPGAPVWQRYQAALDSEATLSMLTILFWLTLGTIFGTATDDALESLRCQLAESWSVVVQEQANKTSRERDQILDALPTICIQTIYRLMVDAFPPEQAAIVQHAQALLDKLGVVVHREMDGFRPNKERLRDMRRKLYRKCIIMNPFMNVLEARRAELRQQLLEGAKPMPPLRWGGAGAEGRDPMDEQQFDDVMEKRLETLAEEAAQGRPPLVDEELAVEHYDSYAALGEVVFERHMAELRQLQDETLSDNADRCCSAESGGTPTPMTRHSAAPRASRFLAGRTMGDLRAEKAERLRRDELLLAKINAPLPERFESKPLAMESASPLLVRMAPGIRGPCGGRLVTVAMRPAKAQFLPKITSPASPSTQSTDSGRTSSESPSGLRTVRSLPKLPSQDPSAPDVREEVLHELPLRVQKPEVIRRVQAELQGRKKLSFEEYTKEYDLLSGYKKRHRSDDARMKRDEQAYVSKVEHLVGSRSTPALRLPCAALKISGLPR